MSLLGDLDDDGMFDFPAGIDAISMVRNGPGLPSGLLDLWFSCDRDFLGFEDGDILRLTPAGGLEVVYSELHLASTLLPSSGTIDIDALLVVEPKVLRISLSNNLAGTTLGDLKDGDILEWRPDINHVSLVASEADVQAWVDNATGGSSAIGDLKSLSLLPGSNTMAFTIQAPTAIDASVFCADNGGELVLEWQETDWGFQQETELDSLCFIDGTFSQPIVLATDVAYVHVGDEVKLRMHHATPGTQLFGIAATNFRLQPQLNGHAGLGVVDPFLGSSRSWPGSGQPPIIVDPSGSAEHLLRMPNLPPGVASLPVWFQVIDRGGQGWSTPIILRLE